MGTPADGRSHPHRSPRRRALPLFSYNPVFIGLRYLLRKKLCYLAIFGVALSVGTILVVLSVFTGFQLQFTSVIRGYLSDLSIRPVLVGEFGYGMHNWQQWRQQVVGTEHVVGVAPFLDTMALLRLPGRPDFMGYVQVRGVDPDLEGTVSKLPDYMEVGQLLGPEEDLPQPRGRPTARLLRRQRLPRRLARRRAPRGRRTSSSSRPPGSWRRNWPSSPSTASSRRATTTTTARSSSCPWTTAEQFAKSNGAVTGLNVRLDDYRNAGAVRDELELQVPGRPHAAHLPGRRAAGSALSGDGSRMAAITEDGQVVVYEVATGKELRRVPAGGHPGHGGRPLGRRRPAAGRPRGRLRRVCSRRTPASRPGAWPPPARPSPPPRSRGTPTTAPSAARTAAPPFGKPRRPARQSTLKGGSTAVDDVAFNPTATRSPRPPATGRPASTTPRTVGCGSTLSNEEGRARDGRRLQPGRGHAS